MYKSYYYYHFKVELSPFRLSFDFQIIFVRYLLWFHSLTVVHRYRTYCNKDHWEVVFRKTSKSKNFKFNLRCLVSYYKTRITT